MRSPEQDRLGFIESRIREPLDPVILNAVLEDARSSLRLEEGIAFARGETREEIIRTIAMDACRLGNILRRRPPSIGLNKDWGVEPKSSIRFKVPVSADISEEYPDGVIFYEPEFLKATAEKKEGRTPVHKYGNLTLRGATAFACFAIWYMDNFPKYRTPLPVEEVLQNYHRIPLFRESDRFQEEYERVIATI